MSSPLKIAAALANSAKSTGPVTPAGRERSAQNAIRHGILAGESVACFIEVLSTLQDELQPVSAIESRYVETMALAEWRRLRLICLEKEQLAIETQRQQAADLGNLNNPGNLSDRGDTNKNTNPGTVDSAVAREVSSIRYTVHAFRAVRRKDEREARRKERDRLRKSTLRSHIIFHSNPLNSKAETTDLPENTTNENAERSGPELG